MAESTRRGGPARRPASSRKATRPSGATAVENGHSQELAAEAEEMVVRLECARLAEEELPLGVGYHRFLDLVSRAVPFDHGTLYVAEWTSGRLRPVAVRGIRVELAEQVRFARGPGLSGWVAQEGRPVVIPSPRARDGRPSFGDEALRAFLAFPLVHDGVVAGVVALARTDRTFSEEEFARLGRLTEVFGQTLARVRRQARIRELLYLDPKTGLSNRHHFLARVEEETHRARTHATRFAVALLDVDPGEGQDRAERLQAFSRWVQDAVRSCDVIARLEEGRFALLLAGIGGERAAAIVRRLARNAVESVLGPGGRLWLGTASGDGEATPEVLLSRAERALAEVT
ncbi:MAG: sensor domain-containing diguanylate cyclase [Armatimonadota bacterium]|nr:sensor domain-containing diguanylate cyclase [Armatimonadota bacterium]